MNIENFVQNKQQINDNQWTKDEPTIPDYNLVEE